MKKELQFEGSVIPEEALLEVRAKKGERFGVGFNTDELQERVQFLQTRIKTFNVVVSTPDVWWYPNLKVVDATNSVWTQLLKVT